MTAATEPKGPERAQEQPTILSTADGCVFGYWRNVVIEIWSARADAALMAEVERLLDTVTRTHPKVSIVVLTLNQVPLPSPEARAEMQRMTARFTKQTIVTSILLESSGFWASAVIAFVTSLQALQNKQMRVKTFSSLDELIAWTVPAHNAESPLPIGASDLRSVLTQALARVEKPGA